MRFDAGWLAGLAAPRRPRLCRRPRQLPARRRRTSSGVHGHCCCLQYAMLPLLLRRYATTLPCRWAAGAVLAFEPAVAAMRLAGR
jgi:hypothetical protein